MNNTKYPVLNLDTMRLIYRRFKEKIDSQIIKPIIESVSPINEAALGSAIGMFVGLTPTVGIQMWVVFMIWLFCKHVVGIRFDLVIGSALVWISNPFTIFFFYYGFLSTGYRFSAILGINRTEITYSVFHHKLSAILQSNGRSFWEIIIDGTYFLLFDLGFPMILGSLFYAIPLAVFAYFFTKRFLLLYRISRASKMGLDYDTWREKYERTRK